MVSNPNVSDPIIGKSSLNNAPDPKILRNVPEKEGFHFYIAIGEPTGEIAVNLADFVNKMESIDARSVNFHFYRKDFEKWIREVLGDAELALRLGRIGWIRGTIQDETLRSEIIRTVKVRLNEIKPPLPAKPKAPFAAGLKSLKKR